MKNILFIVLVNIFFLTGCGMKQPALPKLSFQANDNIAILVDVKDHPTHTHIGTTIFNNFTKEYPYDWGMKSHIIQSLKKTLSEKGYNVIVLDSSKYKKDDVENLIIAKDDQWVVNPEKKELYDTLKNKGLKALIVINDGRYIMNAVYGAFTTSYLYADGYGLFTRSMFGMDNYFSAPSFDGATYILTPVAKITSPLTRKLPRPYFETLGGTFQSKETEEKNHFKAPKDFENITEEEMLPFKANNIAFVDELVKDLTDKL